MLCYLVADFGVRGCGELGDVDGVVGGHVDTRGGLAGGVRLTTARQRTRRERSHLGYNNNTHRRQCKGGRG
jgi:hypothetical protein